MRYAFRPFFLGAALVAGLVASTATIAPAAAAVPHASHERATVGNGFGFGVYDDALGKVSTFTEAPHATVAPGQPTRNLAYDAYFGLRAGGGAGWLSGLPVDRAASGYVDQSGVFAATQHFGPIDARTYVFAPYGLQAPALVLALKATNVSTSAQSGAAAYALLNFHLGSGAPAPSTAGERITYDRVRDAFAETGPSGLTARYVSLVPSAHHGASPSNPYPIGAAGGELVDVADSGTLDDAVAGFEWSLDGLAPGESRWVGVLITLGSDADAQAFVAGRAPDKLVADELSAWEGWRTPPPKGLSPAETRTWRQSEVVLRMAQSREPPPAGGQIVASLPPGPWWITWVRDMSYATAALARAGHDAEASAALDFWKGAKVGAYKSYVGRDYYVSVVRYFGNGDEESDSNADGPNIEFDGFGLSTWAAHAAKSAAFDENAPVLGGLVDAANGLISADSSIWEVHWNGQQKHYGYTSIAAARGLCDAGDAKGAASLRDAILGKLLLPSGGVAQSLEELVASKGTGVGAHDAAIVEAINFGLLNPLGAHAKATVADLESLRVPTGWGFQRNDDGGGYDSQEWVFIDLRVAAALLRMGQRTAAARLLGWVTDQADLNFGLIPELMHRENADYAGAVPMVGFGAGAYMLALLDRAEDVVGKTDPCFPKEGPDVIVPEPDVDAGAPDAATDAVTDAPRDESGPGDAQTAGDTRGGDDASTGPTPSTGDAAKSGCGCRVPARDGASSAGAALGLLAAGAVVARRRRWSARRAILGSALFFSLSALGCSVSKTEDAPADSSTPDAGGDVVIVDTALPGEGGTLDGATDAPKLDAPPGDAPPPPSTIPLRDCKTSFTMPLGRAGAKVELIGEWDGFVAKTALTDGLGTGTYGVELALAPGAWGYKFVIDGADYREDPATRYVKWVGGVENSRVDVGDCKVPRLDVVSTSASADGTIDLEVQYVDGAEAKGPEPASVAASVDGAPVDPAALTFDGKSGRIHVHTAGLSPTKYTFALDAADRAGRKAAELTVPMWVEAEPFAWTDGPMYFVFTDRFRNGDTTNDAPIAAVDPRANWQGGDYAGVIASLKDGYFDALGVRTLWLSPVNENSKAPGAGLGGHDYSGYHGYWVKSPSGVEQHWGSLDDLRALTREAHKHGVRVLFDLVQNQLHQEHPYFAAHKDWFNGDGSCQCGGPGCDWDTHRLDCWFEPYLPDVKWTNPDAVEAMIGDALRWLVAADGDGFRVDAVKHMEDVATTTLRIRIQQTLETGNARYYLVGETFTGGDGRPLIGRYVGPQALWGQFDFPLYWAIDNAFAQGGGTMGDLDNTVVGGETGYVPGATMSPFLGNQDVSRFLSRAAGQIAADPTAQAWSAPPAAPDADRPYDRTFLAFTFLLTQPGVPLVYYGDEIGMPGTSDPDNRRFMRFGADLSAREQRLLDRVKIVAKARGSHPGLRRGARRTLLVDGDGYVYARGAAKDVALVALNRGTTARSVHVVLPTDLGLADGTTLNDLLGGPSITVTAGALDVPFTPDGAALYTRP